MPEDYFEIKLTLQIKKSEMEKEGVSEQEFWDGLVNQSVDLAGAEHPASMPVFIELKDNRGRSTRIGKELV